jgi:hypothetical protein
MKMTRLTQLLILLDMLLLNSLRLKCPHRGRSKTINYLHEPKFIYVGETSLKQSPVELLFNEGNVFPTILAAACTTPVVLLGINVDNRIKKIEDRVEIIGKIEEALQTLITSSEMSKSRIDNLFFSGVVLVGVAAFFASVATVIIAFPTVSEIISKTRT